MITAQIISRVKLLVGLSFTYQGGIIKIVNWQLDGEQMLIKTHSKLTDLKFHIAHAQEFFAELMPEDERGKDALAGIAPTEASTAVVASRSNIADMLPTGTLSAVNAALLDSIKKVQMDPAYIPQAKAISETVQVAVNVAKLQLQAAQMTLQQQGGGQRS